MGDHRSRRYLGSEIGASFKGVPWQIDPLEEAQILRAAPREGIAKALWLALLLWLKGDPPVMP